MTLVVERTVVQPNTVDFDDIVERELRDQVNEAERTILQANVSRWRKSLLLLKKRTEVQFTACRGRRFAAWHDYQTARLDTSVSEQELDKIFARTQDSLRREQDWKHKANFFLSKIEQRLVTLES